MYNSSLAAGLHILLCCEICIFFLTLSVYWYVAINDNQMLPGITLSVLLVQISIVLGRNVIGSVRCCVVVMFDWTEC